MIDIRFPTTLQMMLNLALAEDEDVGLVTSADLARSLGANASLVRKLLVPLTQAGLVTSSLGHTGGVRLARPAAQISLRDVFEAIAGNKPLWTPRPDVPSVCVVSSNIEDYFTSIASAAEQAVLASLGANTLADGLAELRTLQAKKSSRRTGKRR